MNKQPDFGNDLAALNENVNTEVGDVLRVLQQNRNASRPTVAGKVAPPTTPPTEPVNDESATTAQSTTADNSQRTKRDSNRSRSAAAHDKEEVWKSVTTRLRLETIELLKEACLRQELKKKSPHTGQAIIDEALGDWFRKNGYLRNRSDEASE